MKKWKDIPRNEKWMMILILLLLIGLIIRWDVVKDGLVRGFNWFGPDETEASIPADSIPQEQPDVLRMEPEL